MDYISVKETSKKFHLSERRIQKLCETNRIEGCKMISGIWLIPASATKPSDERMTNFPKDSDYLSLKELCDILSISTATGRNWIKLGKLIPEYTDKRKPYFTKQYTEKLKAELQSGKNQSLKSRRNKKFVCGNSLYSAYISENCQNIEPLQQILRIVTDESIALSSDVIQYFIADCALHLLAQKYDLSFKHEKALLSRFLKKEITLSLYDELIYALIADSEQALLFCEKYSPLFDFDYVYEPAEDILGLIYISCKNIDSRKATGSYYTPTKIVKKLIEKLDIASDARILDPCCGTGNFLLQLPAHVRFDQIYGNDTDTISVKITRLNMVLKYDILSVKTLYEHITEADYLASDSKTSYQYIIGNPPFVGARLMNREQKQDMRQVFSGSKAAGNMDYVTAWYRKAAGFMAGTKVRAAFVSTNSICQGEQAGLLWNILTYQFEMEIDFAWKTFVWNNEAKGQAKVHCIILGFSAAGNRTRKYLYDGSKRQVAAHINAYLAPAPDVFLKKRRKPLAPVPAMAFGSMANDGGHLLLEPEEVSELLISCPEAEKWVRRFYGSAEYIENQERYCLWLKGVEPEEYEADSEIRKRVEAVRRFRGVSQRGATRKLAETPSLFGEIRQPEEGRYILVPRVSSQGRPYIPMGYLPASAIASDAVLIVPEASSALFGVLNSALHMAWVRGVAGRLKSDYRYSASIVYNNFPFPELEGPAAAAVEKAAEELLLIQEQRREIDGVRLYARDTMPEEFLLAHRRLDLAVDHLYGEEFSEDQERLSYLFARYREMTENSEEE